VKVAKAGLRGRCGRARTGGAGLTAALAAHDFGAGEVAVLEKSGMVGGTTAMSGGMLWIPLNHHQQANGVEDSWDDVVAYLDALAPVGSTPTRWRPSSNPGRR